MDEQNTAGMLHETAPDTESTVGTPKRVPGKPFAKGADPRRNRRGRPKSFDQLRALAQQIAREPHPGAADKGEAWTRVEVILRDWAASGDPRKQTAFMEYAFGKVKDQLGISAEVTVKGYVSWSPDEWDAREGNPKPE